MLVPENKLAQSIIQQLLSQNITVIVIAPGSRNAPLTIGFTSNEHFTCYSIADERCAAFFAMGLALHLGKPVAVICTSGSAVLNFYPAVAEAYYSRIPLIVISADRPPHKIDIGDGQTIRQKNVLKKHVRKSLSLPELPTKKSERKLSKALFIAALEKLPIHINAPFEEPLYTTLPAYNYEIPVVKNRDKTIETTDLSSFFQEWNSATKKIVLIGSDLPNTFSNAFIEQLAADPATVVFTEANSNVRHSKFINQIDTYISDLQPIERGALRPMVLLTLGGMVVSKRIKTVLRNFEPLIHFHVDKYLAYNTFNLDVRLIQMEIKTFEKAFCASAKALISEYQAHHLERYQKKLALQRSFEMQAAFSDFTVFRDIVKKVPDSIDLHVSNSASIRYMQLFELPEKLAVYCNRGTSGIDGSTSTAIGFAVQNQKPTVLITGDISFFYDSNALWNNYIPNNFKIIIINNGGGGIFRILPGHQENKTFHTFFETAHCLTAEYLAKMYHFDYKTASNHESVEAELTAFFAADSRTILEIFTPTRTNDLVLDQYFSSLKIDPS